MSYMLTLSLPVVQDSLKFLITNEDEEALEGATVTIDETSETTDENGECTFELPYDDYEVTVELEDYKTLTETVAFRNNHKNFTLVLEEEEEEEGGGT